MMVFPVLSSEELNMESAPTEQLAIIRTERGLTIAVTRITLYQNYGLHSCQIPTPSHSSLILCN